MGGQGKNIPEERHFLNLRGDTGRRHPVLKLRKGTSAESQDPRGGQHTVSLLPCVCGTGVFAVRALEEGREGRVSIAAGPASPFSTSSRLTSHTWDSAALWGPTPEERPHTCRMEAGWGRALLSCTQCQPGPLTRVPAASLGDV